MPPPPTRRIDGKQRHLGYFHEESEAARHVVCARRGGTL
jgi:hypothetical protein